MDTTVESGEIDPLNDPDIVFDSVSYEPTDEGTYEMSGRHM